MNLSASFGTVCHVDCERAPKEPELPPSHSSTRGHLPAPTELGMRFAVWAAALRGFPTVAQVSERFGVSRATAYRLRGYWGAATGVSVPAIITSMRRP